ncbi:phage tail tip protein [Escherichia coli]|uniref:phage tail tip domain-containing protein n=1 Tax=Escherichia coli TaxID=562 RepID=UPI00389107D0
MNANSGTLNKSRLTRTVGFWENCLPTRLKVILSKRWEKAFPRNGSYASGTITVTVYDDQAFDRQIVIPPVLFRGGSMKTSTATTNSHTGIQPVSCRC